MKLLSRFSLLLTALLLINLVSTLEAAELTQARGHYEKLARLDPLPSVPDLPLDQQRFASNAAFVEKVRNLKAEFIRIPLDEIKLPPCPANSSRQTRAEIDYLPPAGAANRRRRQTRALLRTLRLQHNDEAYRSGLCCESGQSFLRRAFHRNLVQRQKPAAYRSASRTNVARRELSHVWSLKFKYARIRPWVIDPKVKNLDDANWAAFPSGHSSYAHILAYLYSELAPEFSDIFLADASAIAHSREIIGLHYPSDSEAGRVFARQFVNALLQDDKFKTEFDKVREEWRHVRAESPGLTRTAKS